MASRSSQHRAILGALFVGLLPLAMACQLTSGDEVPRSPPLVHATGGSGGRDVATPDEALADGPAATDATEDERSLDQTNPGHDAGVDTGAVDPSCSLDASCFPGP